MLLTETIRRSTSAIRNRQAAANGKHNAEAYHKALTQLTEVAKRIQDTLDCAEAIRDSGIISTPLLDEYIRSELLSCIDECGNSINEHNKLSMDAVKLLKSKGAAAEDRITEQWKAAAASYSEGPRGYLSTIGKLTDDSKRARALAESISKTAGSPPTIKAVKSLVADVAEAKRITDAFSLNPEIEYFLKKVSAQQATAIDLTPDVLKWFKDNQLAGKLKIRF